MRALTTLPAAALMLLGLLPAQAGAQTALTLYGVMDAGLVLESGTPAGRSVRLTSGVDSGSRLGLKGSEAISGNTTASFVLERGVNLDTGAAGQGGLLFGRQAYVSLSSAAGQLSLGRQYTPYFKLARDLADPFVLGMAGKADNILPVHARLDHALAYSMPVMGPVEAEFMYKTATPDHVSDCGRSASAALRYQQGRWRLGVAQHQQSDTSTGATARYRMLAGQYRGASLSIQGALAHNVPADDAPSTDLLVGLVKLAGVHQLMLSAIVHHDASAARRHAQQIGLGYLYRLSPHSNLYAAYGHLRNRRGASFQIGNSTEAGSGSTGINLGVETAF